ncbi:Uncharacterised protein at_DN1513 [Pycnogonum litorale]
MTIKQQQKKDNVIHASARSVIERAFGRLKGKFRRLKHLDADVKNAQKTIITSCCLHNIIIHAESTNSDDEEEYEEHGETEDTIPSNSNASVQEVAAKRKRLQIINQISS